MWVSLASKLPALGPRLQLFPPEPLRKQCRRSRVAEALIKRHLHEHFKKDPLGCLCWSGVRLTQNRLRASTGVYRTGPARASASFAFSLSSIGARQIHKAQKLDQNSFIIIEALGGPTVLLP